MSRKLLYMCHPIRPLPDSGETVEENAFRALDWLAFLRASEPEITIIAPYLASLIAGASGGPMDDDSDPAQRERGLVDCVTVVGRCDGVILVGGRLSSGMQRELDACMARVDAVRAGLVVCHDLLALGPVPPDRPHPGVLANVQRIAREVAGESTILGESRIVGGSRIVAAAQQCDQMHDGIRCERPHGHTDRHAAVNAVRGPVKYWDTVTA